MKRLFSVILTLILSFICLFDYQPSYADDRLHVEDALVSLQTQTGYIPLQASSVQYNCFAFISDVCSKLYGTTYYYEQQVGSYQFTHTQNYYTVSEKVIAYSSNTQASAEQLKTWLLENAAVGDVLQYGNGQSKHTVLIQHIDNDKIQLYHSNYATSGVSAAVCRLDTIYWSSFTSSPTANSYDKNGNIVSLNLLWGNKLKQQYSLGLSLNRYTYLEQKYQLDSLSKYKSGITKTERTSSTAVKVYWKSIENAAAYKLEYRQSTISEWTVYSDNILQTDCNITNLNIGTEYCFRVSALVNNEWQEPSAEAKKTVLPPKPGSVSFTLSDSGIGVMWAKRSDISGVIVYRSSQKNGEYAQLADLPGNEAASYNDAAITVNMSYFYKVQRYIDYNDVRYFSELSNAYEASYPLSSPSGATASADTKSTAKLKWNAVENASYYTVKYRSNGEKNYTYITTDKLSVTIKKLNLNEAYVFYVYANNAFGASAQSKSNKLTVKPKKATLSVKKKGKGARLTWTKVKSVSGYKIYRSTSKNGKKVLVKTIKGNKAFSYTDKSVKKKKTYYYTVKAYVTKGKKQYEGYASSAKKVKI